jgi:hypothetical protein
MHPQDAALFGAANLSRLRAATGELCWLLERGYTPETSLKLVGDRHALERRQRAAVARCACADSRARSRRSRMQPASALRGEILRVDGFNALTTLEVALSGGIVLLGRDGALRDIAGVHGSYRAVEETVPALECLAEFLHSLGVADCEILLDAPVSNSGRLRSLIDERARERGWCLRARVVADPDAILARSAQIVASADGELLDRCERWFNLARACVQARVPHARVVDLSGESASAQQP